MIILTTAILHVSAAGYSQRITLNEKKVRLDKIFDQISTQTGYDFFYNFKLVEQAKPVSLNIKDGSINDVLKICFQDQPFTYAIKDRTVIVKLNTKSITEISTSTVQKAPIKGKVLDDKGLPMPGVTVIIKGTKVATQTDANGNFTIEARETDVLVFNMIGFTTVEKMVGTEKNINVTLQASTQDLNEVVVTALGVEKTSKSLSYNVQTIKSDELTTVKQTNFINSLSGKAAGVTISSSSSGVGGSAKVTLRGNRSVNGNNQPLYVIDGVPMLNANGSQPTDIYGSGVSDGGDGISNLNPEDIASISILEGASASALYGSQAQNGVILITTKKGKVGKAEINFNSSYQSSQTAYRPKFQNTYGASNVVNKADLQSWGAPITTSYDNLDQYFRNGNNFNNAINFSAGNQLAQTYLSYANTNASGITPTNKLSRHNLNLRETANFLDGKLTVDASLNYINQIINNKPPIGVYPSPLLSLYLFPRGIDITPYKDNYYNTQLLGYDRQFWLTKNGDFHQENPWWILNNEPNVTKRNRYLLTGSVKYTFSQWLNIQVRGNLDRTTDDNESKKYQGTDGNLNLLGNGTYSIGNSTQIQKYADAIANFKIPLNSEDFKIGGLIGTSITDNSSTGLSMGGNLLTPDYFVASNIVAQPSQTIAAGATSTLPVLNPGSASKSHTQLQAAFANLDLAYKDWAFVTATFRQDWSSTLAFTSKQYYNYPSVGLSLVLSQMTKLPDFISFAKVRSSYTEVGNTLPSYLTRILNSQNGQGSLVFNTNSAEFALKPERTKTFETGADLRFLKDRLSLSFTYYKTNTVNQYFAYSPPASSLVGVAYYNAGKIQNTGYQFILGYDAIKNKEFSWNTSFNGSSNKNKILEVRDPNDNTKFLLTGDTYGYSSVVRKGGSYGDIYAQTFAYDDQGRMKLEGTGTAASPYRPAKTSEPVYVGNPNPKFQAGWSNTINYKNFSLSLLVDGKFGGKVMSITQSYMDFMGVSEQSGQARDNGGVAVNAVNATGQPVTTLDPKTYYATIGSRGAMAGAYMYSATVVRLREAALGYNLPIKNNTFKTIRLTLTGRNLFYFYKKAPYDPELTMSTGNGLSGVDAFNMPATRDIGLNLNVTF
ncbi:SusC/RagA family TonB-linked outer membrane protein [Pedobacter nutrimenti]|uniref:SusC/RagA family TonB-linked outer membrane protein n=1 Tax=Pedobacter nutrimenti TaxID=1241337 RepID=UPI00292E1187|nr:SusC/RagA family TonB-linked outer membrane protein [Pedobacter nutrimenti]